MNDAIALRPIVAADLAFLYEVYATTRQDELAKVPWNDEQKAAFLRHQFGAQHDYYQAQFADADFLLILAGTRPIGRLYVQRRADEIRIIDIAVLPEPCHAGVGRQLLKDLMAESEETGKPIRGHVEHYNRALRLFQRMGFVIREDLGIFVFVEWLPRCAHPVG